MNVESEANTRVRADEESLRRSRKTITLGEAAGIFWCNPSPWMIGTSLVAAVTARIVVGDWTWNDALVPAIMLAVFPFFEWVVHVVVLHWKPRKLGPIKIDSLLARKHREHHADPRNVPLIFIPWQALIWLIAGTVAIGLLAFPTAGMGLTFIVGVFTLGLGYEWTHFLIHSDYKPRGRLFRAVWRNHRRHHYKNEHYWFTVTTSGTADRVLGTYPDPSTVPTSPTAKNLHAAS
ncbi:sterol desaturase family protein [Thermocrispum municipale]|uniref:sterol desaturase family protein n=1 Tax=Thermocrispum municipale TaxID=37926 RepID=UPI0003FF3F90|nr:sterol desaturase family protein [Thermocrispum municipale]